ncbi:hypothetical protein L596_005451 [Steinernema carpocapsae]|uniref:Uncharacterized protein n=1 Tax=Steinernema carpocapsae TaxID=34508 RepID=A0A4U8UZ21_STECR|nr:hypothetical protein L596_005451 [Steinernema carpocapsae]
MCRPACPLIRPLCRRFNDTARRGSDKGCASKRHPTVFSLRRPCSDCTFDGLFGVKNLSAANQYQSADMVATFGLLRALRKTCGSKKPEISVWSSLGTQQAPERSQEINVSQCLRLRVVVHKGQAFWISLNFGSSGVRTQFDPNVAFHEPIQEEDNE